MSVPPGSLTYYDSFIDIYYENEGAIMLNNNENKIMENIEYRNISSQTKVNGSIGNNIIDSLTLYFQEEKNVKLRETTNSLFLKKALDPDFWFPQGDSQVDEHFEQVTQTSLMKREKEYIEYKIREDLARWNEEHRDEIHEMEKEYLGKGTQVLYKIKRLFHSKH